MEQNGTKHSVIFRLLTKSFDLELGEGVALMGAVLSYCTCVFLR